MKKLKLSLENICYAAGMDAGNKSMREAKRKTWNEKDYEVAARKYNELVDKFNNKN